MRSLQGICCFTALLVSGAALATPVDVKLDQNSVKHRPTKIRETFSDFDQTNNAQMTPQGFPKSPDLHANVYA